MLLFALLKNAGPSSEDMLHDIRFGYNFICFVNIPPFPRTQGEISLGRPIAQSQIRVLLVTPVQPTADARARRDPRSNYCVGREDHVAPVFFVFHELLRVLVTHYL